MLPRALIPPVALGLYLLVAASTAFAQPTPPRNPPAAASAMTQTTVRYEPVTFTALPQWAADDHLAAFGAFLKTCRRLVQVAAGQASKLDLAAPHVRPLLNVCGRALAVETQVRSRSDARRFFEQHFAPHRVAHNGPDGLLTAYYEPTIDGAREPSAAFATPIYRRPTDLVNLVEESQRGAVGAQLTHARKTPAGLVPYATRSEIDQGALKAKALELLYLADPVDVFFLQIQGSGRIRLPDGTLIRVSYDGKNGHPYTSIGRYLINQGIIDAGRMSLQALSAWLKADAKRGQAVMWQNKSYVFFRELTGEQATAPLGVLDVPLTSGRSLAIDAGHHVLGLPVYVTAPAITHTGDKAGFHRLMIAQDVGSAIRGPERGDLFFGSGEEAARIAGVTKHPGNFLVLLPTAPLAAGLKPSQEEHRTTGALPAPGQTAKPQKP